MYAVHVAVPLRELGPLSPGDLSAYRLRDGALLWQQHFPYPPNSQPLVAQLRPGSKLSVVMPIGVQPLFGHWFVAVILLSFGVPLGLLCGLACGVACCCCGRLCCKVAGADCTRLTSSARRGAALGAILSLAIALLICSNLALLHHSRFPAEVRVFDAETGTPQWSWAPELWEWSSCAGDTIGFFPRVFSGSPRPFCIPNPWSSPAIDAEGTIYLGHANGKLYAISDSNSDNVIDDETEVSSFDLGVAFGHPGAGLAPGMLAIVSCEGVHLFRQ